MHSSRSGTWLVRIWMLVWIALLGWFAIARLTRESAPTIPADPAEAPTASAAIQRTPETRSPVSPQEQGSIGRVIAVEGEWKVGDTLLAFGSSVSAGARLVPASSTDSSARLTVALFDGSLMTVTAPNAWELPAAIGPEKPDWKRLVILLPDVSSRFSAAANGPVTSTAAPRMFALESGYVSVAAVFYQLPPDRYRLELRPKKTATASAPIVLRHDAKFSSPAALRLQVPEAGLYEMRLFSESDGPARLLEACDAAIVLQDGFNHAAAALTEARSAVSNWAGEPDTSRHHAFLHQVLETLTTSAPAFASAASPR